MWLNKGHEFDRTAEQILKESEEFIIFGAGTFGKAFYEDFKNKLKIIGFVDSNKTKQKVTIDNLPVLSPDSLDSKKNQRILVSTGWTAEVFDFLSKKGFVKNKTFFHIDEFMTIYKMYKCNKLFVSNLNIIITEYCTLKCKKCSALNPYIKNKIHYSLDEIDKMLEIYFKTIDEVSILGLLGGDAMVHPQFNDILQFVGETYYDKRVHHIEVYSNAVIIPNRLSLDLMKKYNVIYRFTDYGSASNGKQKPLEIVNILKKNGINYDHAKFNMWSDCGYPQQSNGVPIESLNSFYKSCDRRTCQGLFGSKLFYCSMAIAAQRIGYCMPAETDYFDLNQQDINKKELMEFILGFNERGYLEYCKKCNGGPNINKNYVIPGEQLE